MQHRVQGVVRTDDGSRVFVEGAYFRARVRVVTGYDAANDAFPIHVFVQHGYGLDRLTPKPSTVYETTKDSAIEQGLIMAQQYLQKSPRFQRILQVDPLRA